MAKGIVVGVCGTIALVVFLLIATSSKTTTTTSSTLGSTVSAGEPASGTSSYQVLSNSLDSRSGGGYDYIVGEVKNTGTKAGRFVKVQATLYNTSGKVVGTEDAYLDVSNNTFQPGETAPFKILVTKQLNYATYRLQVRE